jgi:hypothetical protein
MSDVASRRFGTAHHDDAVSPQFNLSATQAPWEIGFKLLVVAVL